MNLKQGYSEKVQEKAAGEDSLADLQLLYADAFALQNNWGKANTFVNNAKLILGENADSTFKAAIETRSDSLQWQYYLSLTYQDSIYAPGKFKKLHYRTKLRMLGKAIDKGHRSLVKAYSDHMLSLPAETGYFEHYIDIIHYLAYIGETNAAKKWVAKITRLNLRKRFKERLKEQKSWISDLEKLN